MTTSSTKPSKTDSYDQAPLNSGTPDSVPLLDLRRQYAQVREEVLAAIEELKLLGRRE